MSEKRLSHQLNQVQIWWRGPEPKRLAQNSQLQTELAEQQEPNDREKVINKRKRIRLFERALKWKRSKNFLLGEAKPVHRVRTKGGKQLDSKLCERALKFAIKPSGAEISEDRDWGKAQNVRKGKIVHKIKLYSSAQHFEIRVWRGT